MVTQLAFLVDGNADLDLGEYGRLLETCRARSASPHEKAEPSPVL